MSIVEMLNGIEHLMYGNAKGYWALSVNETGLRIYWYMSLMVFNVCCKGNAKGYWALWMVLIMRMPWILDFG
jgi:hypothetical protein